MTRTTEFRVCSNHGVTDESDEDEILSVALQIKKDKPSLRIWLERRQVIDGTPRAWVHY